MPHWAWLTIAVALVVALFGFLLGVGRRIEPEDRELHNDEWLGKGGD
jgi:hypothetical protein